MKNIKVVLQILYKMEVLTLKKLFSLAMASLLTLSLAACGGGDKPAEKPAEESPAQENSDQEDKPVKNAKDTFDIEITDEMKEAAKSFSVGMVTDTGGIDDKSFNQGTWEGVKKFGELTGASVQFSQSNSDAEYVPNLSTFAEDGVNIVVAAGYLFEDSIKSVSDNFQDTHFLLIDQPIEGKANVATASFAENEGSYLVGIAAGEMAKKAEKTMVGFIGGGESELIQRFEAGYEAGVKSVDPNIEVKVDYVGGFSDQGKAQSIAKKMYDEGAYVIYHASGGAGNGLIKEAKDRRLNGQDVWAIGVDRDQYEDGIYEDGKSAILTSMVKRVDVAAFDVCMQDLQGKFPGGKNNVYNIKNGGLDVPQENPNLPEDVIAKVQEAKEKIKSGELEIPKVPSRIAEK